MQAPSHSGWTHSLNKAAKDVRNAYLFGLLAGSVTLLVSIAGALGVMEGFDLWNLIDVAIIFSLTIWIGRVSRVAATLMFAYAVTNMIYRLVAERQPAGALLSLVGIYFYYRGMIGTYRHHTLSHLERMAAETDESITGRAECQVIKEHGRINFKRVLAYVGILFLWTFAVGFVFGFIKSFMMSGGQPVPPWVDVGQALAVFAVSILVFVRLGLVQHDRVFAHASCVGLAVWLLSFPLNVGLLRLPVTQWVAQVILPAIAVTIGVPIGRAWARKRLRDSQYFEHSNPTAT